MPTDQLIAGIQAEAVAYLVACVAGGLLVIALAWALDRYGNEEKHRGPIAFYGTALGLFVILVGLVEHLGPAVNPAGHLPEGVCAYCGGESDG